MRGHLTAVFSVTSTCTSHRVWSTTHFLLEELHNWSARPVRTANGSQPHPTQMKTAICFGPGQCQKSCSHGRLRNNRSHTRLQLMLACGDFFCFMGDKNMQRPEWPLHISEQKAPCCIAHLAFFAQACRHAQWHAMQWSLSCRLVRHEKCSRLLRRDGTVHSEIWGPRRADWAVLCTSTSAEPAPYQWPSGAEHGQHCCLRAVMMIITAPGKYKRLMMAYV